MEQKITVADHTVTLINGAFYFKFESFHIFADVQYDSKLQYVNKPPLSRNIRTQTKDRVIITDVKDVHHKNTSVKTLKRSFMKSKVTKTLFAKIISD